MQVFFTKSNLVFSQPLYIRYLLSFPLSICPCNKTESRHATHLTDCVSLVAKPSVMPSNSHKTEKAPHSKQACQWHFLRFTTALSPFPTRIRPGLCVYTKYSFGFCTKSHISLCTFQAVHDIFRIFSSKIVAPTATRLYDIIYCQLFIMSCICDFS